MGIDPKLEEWIVRLLYYLAGVASTVVGSWIASKIRLYQENRRSHHDEIKQKLLIPLLGGLQQLYMGLVQHKSPVLRADFGREMMREDAKANEEVEVQAPLLFASDPSVLVEAQLDEALLADARQNHCEELMASWEGLRDAWSAYARKCEVWATDIAGRILGQSGLPAFGRTQSYGEPYIMHLQLAVFVYRRLFQLETRALRSEKQSESWLLFESHYAVVKGTEQQVNTILAIVDNVIESERPRAHELRYESAKLRSSLLSLSSKLSLAIAEQKLRGRCSLVTFF